MTDQLEGGLPRQAGELLSIEEKPSIVAGQPAESTGVIVGSVVALLISYGIIKGNDAAAWAIVIGALPMVVTNLINWLSRRRSRTT